MKQKMHSISIEQPRKRKKWYKNPYLRTITRGFVVSLPIILLITIVYLIFKLIFNFLSPIANLLYVQSGEPHWSMYLFSLVVLLGLLYGIGRILRNSTGEIYFKYFEKKYLKKVPLYTTVRDLVQQFAGLKSMPFSQVVLVDPYNSGVFLTGFVTEEVTDNIYTVFVPTAPNPTNGNIYHVPISNLTFLSVSPEDAMRTIVGMGTGSTCLFSASNSQEVELCLDNKLEC